MNSREAKRKGQEIKTQKGKGNVAPRWKLGERKRKKKQTLVTRRGAIGILGRKMWGEDDKKRKG